MFLNVTVLLLLIEVSSLIDEGVVVVISSVCGFSGSLSNVMDVDLEDSSTENRRIVASTSRVTVPDAVGANSATSSVTFGSCPG